jgi:hypothetical protein
MAATGPGCADILSAPKSADLPDGVGLFAQAARLASGDPILIYYDHTNGNLKSATYSSATMGWQTAVLDGQNAMATDTGDVGQWCSVAVGADNALHIAYQDAIANQLLYLHIAAGAQTKEVVDDGTRPDGLHRVGDDTHIILDAMGAPRIVYQDGRDVTMQMTSRMTSGSWTRVTLPNPMAAVGHGFFPKLALDGTSLWASDFFFDRSTMPFGQLEVLRMP